MVGTQFQEELLALMDQKDHWAWRYFIQAKITKEQLKLHFRQEFAVYVRDFPVFLGRIYSKNPPMDVRYDLAENIFEEETGGISKLGPHPHLFLKMMEGLGFKKSEFEEIKLYPEAQTYRDWLDEITLNGVWYEGAAVIAIFVEGSVKDRNEITGMASEHPASNFDQDILFHPLVQFHGVRPENMDLIRAHSMVEKGHRKAAWKMVLDYTDTIEKQKKVKNCVKKTLVLWHAYRDRVAKECNLNRGD
ncbi:MAG: iron-containing redox enzyme family protein [Nitrospiria bacterium]